MRRRFFRDRLPFVLDSSCRLWLPFYKYGANVPRIWDRSEFKNHGTICGGATPTPCPKLSGMELISNGGMETGNPPTGWSAGSTPEVFERSGSLKQSGNYSCHINDSTPSYGGFVVIPYLSLGLGTTYKLSYWYYIVSGSIYSYIGNALGTEYKQTIHSTTNYWLCQEILYTPTLDTSNLLSLKNYSNTVAAEFYIDNVGLREVVGHETLGWYTDGIDDYFYVANSSSLNGFSAFTFLYWVRWLGCEDTGYKRLLGTTGYDFDLGIYMMAYPYTLRFYDGAWKDTTYTMPANQWTQLAVVWDGTNILTYANGTHISTVAGGRWTGNTNLYFGAGVGADAQFTGWWGEVFLFNRVLAANEIRNHYELTRHIYGV